jgi:hypothetical protein
MKTLNFSFLFLFILFTKISYTQNNINGQTNTQKLNLVEPFKRGLPPNIYVDLKFKDENGNGILEAEENAKLFLEIINKGKGPAQGLKISLHSKIQDKALVISDDIDIRKIRPNESRKIEFDLRANFGIKSNEHKMELNISEYFGYDMDPAFLVVNTLQYQPAKVVLAGFEIIDKGEGTGAKITDGLLQAGEQVIVKVVVQNIGQNLAEYVNYKVFSTDLNIYVDEAEGELGSLKIGQVKEFYVKVSPNNKVKTSGELPIFLSVSEIRGLGNLNNQQLPISLEKVPPKVAVLNVKPDIDLLKKQVARIEYQSEKFSTNNTKIKSLDIIPFTTIKRPNSIALVLGVENYYELPIAPYAKKDAETVGKYFKDVLHVGEVVTLTDKDVSGFFFEKYFNPEVGILSRKIVKGETELFVYYSGHGIPDKDGKETYIVPFDGSADRPEKTGGYSLNNLFLSLSKLEAKNVTIILDACFSGATRQSETYAMNNLTSEKGVGVKIKPLAERPWETNPSFRVLTSSSGSETSLGYDQAQVGLFTYYLCLGLQGEADKNMDKKLTIEELMQYINLNVPETARKLKGTPQTPNFFGAEGYILTTY